MPSDYAEEIHAALTHAAAVVLLELQKLERGYADLLLHGPVVAMGLEVAHAEAEARGVPPAEIAITAPMVLARAQEMGAAGVNPLVVADETKSEEAVRAEAERQEQARAEAEDKAKTAEEKEAEASAQEADAAERAREDQEEKARVEAQARAQEEADAAPMPAVRAPPKVG